MTSTAVAPCVIRDADGEEAAFLDLVADQAGLVVPAGCGRSQVRVATCDGRVAGFARVTVDEGGAARLDYVYVHHHARRTGVGRALVTDTARLASSQPVRIEAHPCAEVFFRRIGAVREGTLAANADHPFCRALFGFQP